MHAGVGGSTRFNLELRLLQRLEHNQPTEFLPGHLHGQLTNTLPGARVCFMGICCQLYFVLFRVFDASVCPVKELLPSAREREAPSVLCP